MKHAVSGGMLKNIEYTIGEVPERVVKKRKDWAANDAQRDAGLRQPDDITAARDISYGPYDKWNLLDVYSPAAVGKLPVIVNIHGGGYFYGDKELYSYYCMHLAESGFKVVNFNYRTAPEFLYPAPLEDTCNVLLWIRDNAEKYGLDTGNVFIIGDSAGAQLASQYGVIHTNPEYAKYFNFCSPKEMKLRGISLACGMYDFKKRAVLGQEDDIVKDYLGDLSRLNGEDFDDLKYINKDYPPTYLFTCFNDFLYSECEPMAELLRSRGCEADFRVYGWRAAKEIAHVFHCNLYLPEGQKANADQIEFMKKHIVFEKNAEI